MNKINNILILAGGDSTRFWPLDNKFLYSFLGKSLIEHIIDSISKYAENIVVVLNPSLKDKLQLKGKHNVQYIFQKKGIKGMDAAIISAKKKLKGKTLILNANDLIDFNSLTKLLNSKTKKDITFFARKISKYFPGGYLKFKDNKLVGIIEKPKSNNVPSDLIKLVVDYYSDIQKLFKALKDIKDDSDDKYEHAVSKLIQKKNVGYLEYNKYWYTIKYPWQVLNIMNHFLLKIKRNNISSSVKISKSAIINKLVIIESGVKIGDFAKINGPCFIGKNTIIADYALVRNSHIGENCLIGGYSEVTRSYIGNNVYLHRNYIGDSVLGNNVLFGAGAITANFRFDEKMIKSEIKGERVNTNLHKFGAIVGSNSKIGVNATLFPGSKIGKNSFIIPGSVITHDIKDNVFFPEKRK